MDGYRLGSGMCAASVVTASKNACSKIHHTLTELGWKDAAAVEIKTTYLKYLSVLKKDENQITVKMYSHTVCLPTSYSYTVHT